VIEIKKTSQAALRRFLHTEAGEDMLSALRQLVPGVAKGQPHEMIFDGGRVEGFRDCIRTLVDLADMAKKEEENLENPGLE
jgi:hypothetical protein